MALFGFIELLIAFAGVVISVVCLLGGHLLKDKSKPGFVENINWAGHVGILTSFVALTFCCGMLVFCFMTGDTSIEYVVKNQSNATGVEGWLYRLSGLWGGREGSLLFWAWLIVLFSSLIAFKNIKKQDKLNNATLLVVQLVVLAFISVLLFSESNGPFKAMDPSYFNEHGHLTGAATLWGMNSLLEHWAMAIHPPTLFIGYAGLTIPFAYAIGALIVDDPSKAWVERSTRYTLVSWLFLGIGIGLGAVWAYVVLGWGGYWGWDPVENASLLSWFVCLALIHSFTIYRQRGAFKRWSVMCACITFAFVVVGTFITRSGIVESVHAFEGDTVSLVLFLVLIIVSVLVGAIGLFIRRKSFGPSKEGKDEIESIASRDAAYYINNVVMIISAFLILYLTLSSIFPEWMPFGGYVVSAATYNTIARPLGILYCLLIAVCPLLAWGKTQGKAFFKKARVPGICALVVFALLMVYFFTTLLPRYGAIVAAGGASAEIMIESGPAWYYNGLTVVGFLVASLLFFNALFLLARTVRTYAQKNEVGVLAALPGALKKHTASFGGYIAHISMAIILVGLIGSSMYVTTNTSYLGFDQETDTAEGNFYIEDYRLEYRSNEVSVTDNQANALYTLTFDVYKGDSYLGAVSPSVQVAMATQQQKLNASVLSSATEDLFVVYRGVNTEGAFSLDVRVNPLISFVWVGFVLMMVGVFISSCARRVPKNKEPEKDS